MTNNQLHGKKFEDLIKACGLFQGAADAGRGPTAEFDIEARFDRQRILPTSIKSSGNDTINLSDARRFFRIANPFRMLVARYQQNGAQKSCGNVHEFIVTMPVLEQLRGQFTLADVTEFHHGLLIDHFPVGQHGAARNWARERKLKLAAKTSKIILNPKIDGKSQRRLQCSVQLGDLIGACQRDGTYILHDETIGDLVLPIVQISAPRQFIR
jgi:hypothetical protein